MFGEVIGIYFLITPGVWVWNKNGGQAEEWEFSQGRRTLPRHDKIRAGEGSAYLLV